MRHGSASALFAPRVRSSRRSFAITPAINLVFQAGHPSAKQHLYAALTILLRQSPRWQAVILASGFRWAQTALSPGNERIDITGNISNVRCCVHIICRIPEPLAAISSIRVRPELGRSSVTYQLVEGVNVRDHY